MISSTSVAGRDSSLGAATREEEEIVETAA